MTGVGDTRTFTVFIPFEDVSQDDVGFFLIVTLTVTFR